MAVIAPAATPSGVREEAHLSSAPPFVYLDNRPGMRDRSGRLLLKNLPLHELQQWCESVGERPTRAQQLYRGMYRGLYLRSLADADGRVEAYSAAFKAKFDALASLSGGLSLQSAHAAKDGTTKLVSALHGDEGGAEGIVETVLIPMTSSNGVVSRYTVCVSSQVGCAMNCQFCHTGRMGLMGNLSAAQIVEQVVEARRWLASEGAQSGRPAMPIANVVFMGMGEPLHNMDAVLAAVDVLADPAGLMLSRNKIVISTVGLVPEMRAFLDSKKAKLAVSLHATTDEVRDWIVPVNRRYPLAELVSLLEEYYPMTTQHARGDRFVVIEYVLLRGVNDSVDDAARLAGLLSNVYCMVNLIVFNPHDGTEFERTPDGDVAAFRQALTAAGKVCTVRASKGDDTMAACGQLGDVKRSVRPAPKLQPPDWLAHAQRSARSGRTAHVADSMH